MKIAVLTDSSAYLTKEQQEKYHIDVLPIPIMWGDKTYRDMIDIGYEEFYKKLADESELPSTSQPSPGDLQKRIDEYVEQGYTDVIVITLSSGISGYYSTVESIANSETRIKIHPFDSKITCAGEADYAMLAGRLVEAGADVDLIMHDLSDLQKTMDVRFMVDNLSHLKRTGRLSNAASFVGTLFKIKPILSMDVQDEGKISAIAKERQTKRAYKHVQNDFDNLTKNMPYNIQCTIFDSLDPDKKEEWIEDYRAKFPRYKFDESIIGPVVGVHVGQGTMAMIWCRDLDDYFDKNGKPIEEINSNSLELVVAENKKLVKHCNRLREYCITSVNIFDKCSEYETEIKNLQQENSSLKEKIKELKSYIKSIFTVLENSFNISKKKLFKLLLQKQKSI